MSLTRVSTSPPPPTSRGLDVTHCVKELCKPHAHCHSFSRSVLQAPMTEWMCTGYSTIKESRTSERASERTNERTSEWATDPESGTFRGGVVHVELGVSVPVSFERNVSACFQKVKARNKKLVSSTHARLSKVTWNLSVVAVTPGGPRIGRKRAGECEWRSSRRWRAVWREKVQTITSNSQTRRLRMSYRLSYEYRS